MTTRTLMLATLLVLACGKDRDSKSVETSGAKKPETETTPTPTAGETAPAAGETAPAAGETAPAAGAEPDKLDLADIGLSTPESVLYDDAEDLYLVSNINGGPADIDDNGFISRIAPDGTVKELKWIDGGKPDVKLDAPKGTAFMGDTLYVADVKVVRMFDRKTGAPKGEVAIKGATFLNDVVASGDAIYVTDSGLKPDFKPSGTDAVYRIDAAGKAKAVIKDKKLGAPNGLAPAEDGLWVVTFGTGEMYQVGADGKRKPGKKPPKGQLDGVIAMPDGSALVSSWEGKAVYRTDGDGWKEVATDVEAPADIGYDTKRKRLLIPLFTKNGLAIRTVE